ncbi:energy-coupling factor transporter transmembrane protein EcfT [Deltaproteobacteria bacterium OttesenSCG-928-K17]|nr:energy-coupling factor transporter transmembrane protein EcfT [Deltaproteobacteria bacterium OttesenSCG-928-K17]
MPDLSKIKGQGHDRLNLSPEVRLGLAVAASLAALIIDNIFAAGLLLAASVVYVFAQVRPRTIGLVYLFFLFMAHIALGCFWLLGFVFAAMKDASPFSVILPFTRLAISINLILPLALNASLSGLAGTMNRLKMPGLIKLPLMVTIRFIPSFLNDLQQLRQAVRLRFRGRGGFFFWLRRPVLWWRVFFLPLVVRLIRTTDELAVASELKGLSVETDFGRQALHLKAADGLAIAGAALAIAGASILQVLYAAG